MEEVIKIKCQKCGAYIKESTREILVIDGAVLPVCKKCKRRYIRNSKGGIVE